MFFVTFCALSEAKGINIEMKRLLALLIIGVMLISSSKVFALDTPDLTNHNLMGTVFSISSDIDEEYIRVTKIQNASVYFNITLFISYFGKELQPLKEIQLLKEVQPLYEGAQIYEDYYKEKIMTLQTEISTFSNMSDKERNDKEKEIQNLKQKMDDIYRLNGLELVSGKKLNVPVFNQLNTNTENHNSLCWATCASMVVSYYMDNPENGIDRTYDIAITTAQGSTSECEYNTPRWWPNVGPKGLNLIDFNQTEFADALSPSTIKSTIDHDSPFGVLFRAIEGDSGHYVLGIGYATAQGHPFLVISNDPWMGIQRIQAYEEFKTYEDKVWLWTVKIVE